MEGRFGARRQVENWEKAGYEVGVGLVESRSEVGIRRV